VIEYQQLACTFVLAPVVVCTMMPVVPVPIAEVDWLATSAINLTLQTP
jgi:hypothetical protein